MENKTILVTGCAGFIGFHTSKFLLERGDKIIGMDNMNNYYAISLKQDRLKILKEYSNFTFYTVTDTRNKLTYNDFTFEVLNLKI